MQKIIISALCMLSITVVEAKLRKKSHSPQAIKKTEQPKLTELVTQVPIKTAKSKRTITIANNITPEMLIKKHWTGNYTPDPFAIIVNGTELAPGQKTQVALEDDTLNLKYTYSFMKGYRKGANEVTFKLPEKQDQFELSFSWDDKYRVLIKNATAIKKREV